MECAIWEAAGREGVPRTLKVVLEVMAQAISMLLVHMRDDALLGRILG